MEASGFAADLLHDQVALVTGGATGIGNEICRVLGGHGARVTLVSRKRVNLEAAVHELQAEGVDAQFGVCDVRDAEAVRSVVDAVVEKQGSLDILVDDAAGNVPATTARRIRSAHSGTGPTSARSRSSSAARWPASFPVR